MAGDAAAGSGVDLPPELIDLLTYGRGADNRRLKAAGFHYRYTSAGAVHAFAEAARLRRTVGRRGAYRYERDVEQFFRHSPAVVRDQALTDRPAQRPFVDQCQGSDGRLYSP